MNQDRNPLIIKMIKAYQKNKTTSGHCKFYPTCSNYAIGCYKKFNFFYASLLVAIRILRCNYFAKRRYYPVPLSRKEKQVQKEVNGLKESLNNDFVDYLLSVASVVKSGEELYRYIYDYTTLPLHPTATEKDNAIYASRFLISKELINNKESEALPIEEYLEVASRLFELDLIPYEPIQCDISYNNNLYLIPLDQLSVNDLLEISGVDSGIIIINGECDNISYRDFEVKTFDGTMKTFKKQFKGRNKLILLTQGLKVFPYLEDINYAINLYSNYQEVDYFYSINKKKY